MACGLARPDFLAGLSWWISAAPWISIRLERISFTTSSRNLRASHIENHRILIYFTIYFPVFNRFRGTMRFKSESRTSCWSERTVWCINGFKESIRPVAVRLITKMGRGAGASVGGNTRSVNESPKGSFSISDRVLVSLPGEITSMWIKSRREHSDCILPLYGNTLLQARAERRYGVPRSSQTARPPRTYLRQPGLGLSRFVRAILGITSPGALQPTIQLEQKFS